MQGIVTGVGSKPAVASAAAPTPVDAFTAKPAARLPPGTHRHDPSSHTPSTTTNGNCQRVTAMLKVVLAYHMPNTKTEQRSTFREEFT